ncbi:MAG TPA: efflux RND transporter periplasmic adaptor subunit, partial [Hyphomicrobiales bacterium]|nr:efflux RND transporter periplasmic adaptor subunit [Hyphomicrobiales bacterium]
MNKIRTLLGIAALLAGLNGCGGTSFEHEGVSQEGHGESAEAEPAKGPHNGRLLVDGDFVLELAIFETGVPPEFRAWVTDSGAPVAPDDVELHITLTRLGDVKNEIGFTARDEFLRGDTVIHEPHSFIVSVDARHQGRTHKWSYENFEGRTSIGAEIAEAFGLETEIAGGAVIKETVTVYGSIQPNREQHRSVSARFDGAIQSVHVSAGDTVRKGQPLATIESNESLNNYTLTAPIGGIVTERVANPGEQTGGRKLFTIVDTSTVWAELAIFPSNRARVREGARVSVRSSAGEMDRQGIISRLSSIAQPNQSVLARVVLDNADGEMVPGTHVTGNIEIAEHSVPLAVKRTGLQSFRDFTVVYAQIGDEYEVRMLELGRQDAEWIEVLGGQVR